MKKLKQSVLLILILTLLSNCAPKNLSGTYRSYAPSGMLMAGKVIRFYDGNKFELEHWSDDISSNTKGKGSYTLSKNRLALDFDYFEPEEGLVIAKEIQTSDTNNVEYIIKVKGLNDKVLPGVMIEVVNEELLAIEQGITDVEGISKLAINKQSKPTLIKIAYFGMKNFEVKLTDLNSKELIIQLAPISKYFDANEKMEYKIKSRNDFLILENRSRKDKLKKSKERSKN